MDNRVYILGTAVGSLSIGIGIGKRSSSVKPIAEQIEIVETEQDEVPVEFRNESRGRDEKEVGSSMGEKRENPAGSRVSDSPQADYYDYTKPYSQIRDEFEDSLSEEGDPEEELDSDEENFEEYEVFDDSDEWSKHPNGYQPIALTLYVDDDLCLDPSGMFVDPNRLEELVGEVYYEALEHDSDEDDIFYIRNNIDMFDVQLIVTNEPYYEAKYGRERKGKKGGKFRDIDD